jgi:phosphate transport system protein
MSHYEERLEQGLAEIRARVAAIGERIENALADALRALSTDDRQLAAKVILGDLAINREIRAIDRNCHTFVAQHVPSAGHLRFVSSVLRLDVALERLGDYAVTIAREAVQLSAPPSPRVAGDVELIGNQALGMFSQAMKAFNERSAEQAKATKAMANQVEATFEKVFSDLLELGQAGERPIKDLFALLVIINRLGRVSDQSKNICEETIFAETGETKEPKVYRVLFLDRRNDCLGLLAEAFARKAFPESGRYDSAGWEASTSVRPACESFMGRNGLDLDRLVPSSLDEVRDRLGDYHVIVGLEAGAAQAVGEIPFHTTLVEWDVEPFPAEVDAERQQAALTEAFRDLNGRVRDLMVMLRGEGAG